MESTSLVFRSVVPVGDAPSPCWNSIDSSNALSIWCSSVPAADFNCVARFVNDCHMLQMNAAMPLAGLGIKGLARQG